MKLKYIFAGLLLLSILVMSCSPVNVGTGNKNSEERCEILEEKEEQEGRESLERAGEMEEWEACEGIEKEGITQNPLEENHPETDGQFTGKILAGTTSKYVEFTPEDYENSLRENKKILLYFYANWCPLCKKEQPETIAAFNQLQDPEWIGFRVNYRDSDTDEDEEALAREFGVPYQHTKVILKDGKMVLKAPDSWDTPRYLEELQK